MQKSEDDNLAIRAHRRPKVSTTLSRKYVKKPSGSTNVAVSVKQSSKVSHFNTPVSPRAKDSDNAETVVVHPLQATANRKMQERAKQAQLESGAKVSAKELKDQAIRKALAAANAVSKEEDAQTKNVAKMHFGFGRLVLALSCAAVVVFAIVYFVNLNMPDISLKVAAMQTGIDASYPSYVPRDYNISSITSENNKITLDFKSTKDDGAFSLIEEASSWDSNALMTNYVQQTFSDNYAIVREQGLTIYISEKNAAWVNGGIVYKLNITSGSLTHKQIRSIAVSL
ncbi:hypothetical protein IKE97_00050 [Candidatus Saccharibacteria bacterium]|nr:hypothetical protein [Candidatus Saccharibacteria bacterium]